MKKLIVFLVCAVVLCWTAVPTFGKEVKTVKVACVGNSITYGIGVKDRLHDAYPAQLQSLLGEGYLVGNFGRPGATLLAKGHRPYVSQPEYEQAKAFAADIVVIHLGINDTDPRNWPHYRDNFVRDYLDLIQSFRTVNPKVRCMVARMTPIADRHPRHKRPIGERLARHDYQYDILPSGPICQGVETLRSKVMVTFFR